MDPRPHSVVGEDGVSATPYSVSILVKITDFLGYVHGRSADKDLRVGGVSYLELLILYELWAGERLICEKSILRRRDISVVAACVSLGAEIWKSCTLLGYVLRSLKGSAWWNS